MERVLKDQSINDLILLKQSRHAKDCTTNTLKELVKETDRSILHSKPDSDVTNNSRASMSTIAQLVLELDGKFTLQPDKQLRLRQRTGSSTTIGSRTKVGILGDPQHGLHSNFFFFFFLIQVVVFACWGFRFTGNRRVV